MEGKKPKNIYSWQSPRDKLGKIKNKSRSHKTTYEKQNQIYLTVMGMNCELVCSHWITKSTKLDHKAKVAQMLFILKKHGTSCQH